MKKRNPFVGGVIAAIMLLYGGWRLYGHYSGSSVQPNWRLYLSYAIVIYGLVLVYNIFKEHKDETTQN